jgi:hypothetical protein
MQKEFFIQMTVTLRIICLFPHSSDKHSPDYNYFPIPSALIALIQSHYQNRASRFLIGPDPVALVIRFAGHAAAVPPAPADGVKNKCSICGAAIMRGLAADDIVGNLG